MGNLRRLCLKPNRETGHIHVHDLVTGAEVGQPIRKVELEEVLAELNRKDEDTRQRYDPDTGKPVAACEAFDRTTLMKQLIELFPAEADNELAGEIAKCMEEHRCSYPDALKRVTATELGQALWNSHLLESEAGYREFKPTVTLPARGDESSELQLAVRRWMEDNDCSYSVALSEFCKTPRGQMLWAKHLEMGNDFLEGSI
jgi:hypothetical protein